MSRDTELWLSLVLGGLLGVSVFISLEMHKIAKALEGMGP